MFHAKLKKQIIELVSHLVTAIQGLVETLHAEVPVRLPSLVGGVPHTERSNPAVFQLDPPVFQKTVFAAVLAIRPVLFYGVSIFSGTYLQRCRELPVNNSVSL